jgi:uncharacterized membrane protein (UPF0127 family)
MNLLRLAAPLACLALGISACDSDRPPTAAPPGTVPVALPDGGVIHAELVTTPQKQAQGLMFRPELAPDRGMLFLFTEMAPRPFWMYQTVIPLDMIWLNRERRIVEIAADVPPCPSKEPEVCPNFGGNAASMYVLELAAGQAAARGLKVGGQIGF